MQRAEAVVEDRVIGETPVIEHKHLLPIDLRRIGLLDHEDAVEPPRQLLEGAVMRVIPVGAGVGWREVVEKLAAGLHHRLRELRRTVHRVVDSNPVPVHRRGLGQSVHEPAHHPFALPHADGRPRNPPVVSPDRGFGIVRWREARGGGPGVEDDSPAVVGVRRERPATCLAKKRGRPGAAQKLPSRWGHGSHLSCASSSSVAEDQTGVDPLQWTVYGLGFMQRRGRTSRNRWVTGNPSLGDDGVGYTTPRCRRRSPSVRGDGRRAGFGRGARIRGWRRNSPMSSPASPSCRTPRVHELRPWNWKDARQQTLAA